MVTLGLPVGHPGGDPLTMVTCMECDALDPYLARTAVEIDAGDNSSDAPAASARLLG